MQTRSRHAWWLAAIAVPGLACAGSDPGPLEDVLTMRVEGRLVVSAEGKVIAHEVSTKLEPAIRGLIDKAVGEWLFLPPTVDGKPGAAKSDMRITLVGTRLPEGYQVKIDNVVFPSPPNQESTPAPEQAPGLMRVAKMQPMPKYPRYHINGMVTLMIRIAPDGTVANIASTQCSLYFAGGMAAAKARACKTMEDNAVRAIRQWTFAFDGKGRMPRDDERIGVLPVAYNMIGDSVDTEPSAPGKWRLESRTPYRAPAWLSDEGAQRVGTADFIGNELLPASSQLRFRAAGGVL